jgi:hypothetical protein
MEEKPAENVTYRKAVGVLKVDMDSLTLKVISIFPVFA